MNKKSSASSSSTGTANSKAYDEIARLGERIVASLSRQNGRRREHDPLTRWMAHEIAAAMTAVKKARSAKSRRDAAAYASDLILKVWAARERWPEGWPPKSARERMSRLETAPPFAHVEREDSGSAWIDRFGQLHDIGIEEQRIWWMVGLLERGIDDVRDALDGVPPTRQEGDDFKSLQLELKLYEQAQAWAADNSGRSKDVRKAAKTELGKLAKKRRELLAEVLASDPPTDGSK
ncbi:MAG: hypothetical protein QM729_06155 [Solirubrobacterales bacterium]